MKRYTKTTLAAFAVLVLVSFSLSSQASTIRTDPIDAFTLAANDDGSSPLTSIGFTINFNGFNYDSLYANNNGNVTFNSSMSTYTPFGIQTTSIPLIAPFFADVDTTASNTMSYGAGTIGSFDAFLVNWIDVGYFNSHADLLNSFQLVLFNRDDISPGDFDIEFNYSQIEWETGDASDGSGGLGGTSAAVGYSNGAGTYYEFEGSRVNGAFLDGGPESLVAGSNIDTPGRYLFQVRNGAVIPDDPSPAVPEPGTVVLLSLGLAVAGIARFRRTSN